MVSEGHMMLQRDTFAKIHCIYFKLLSLDPSTQNVHTEVTEASTDVVQMLLNLTVYENIYWRFKNSRAL